MKKLIVIPAATVGVIAAGGLAWAALGGSVNVPDAIQGLATGGAPTSCQTGALTFTVPDPTWDSVSASYVISSVDYSGIGPVCVQNGTADLELRLVNGAQTVASATASNMSSSTGTLILSTPVEFDAIGGLDFVYLVRG